MNKENSMFYADQMQFIVAAMTKDYEKAKSIANTILKTEPENKILRNYLPIIEREISKKKELDRDSVTSDSTDSSDSSSDSNDDDSNNSDDSTDSDSSNQNTVENNKKRDPINWKRKKIHQKLANGKLILDGSKSKLSNNRIDKEKSEINQVKSKHKEFEGKLIRVLPIRLSEEIKKKLNI